MRELCSNWRAAVLIIPLVPYFLISWKTSLQQVSCLLSWVFNLYFSSQHSHQAINILLFPLSLDATFPNYYTNFRFFFLEKLFKGSFIFTLPVSYLCILSGTNQKSYLLYVSKHLLSDLGMASKFFSLVISTHTDWSPTRRQFDCFSLKQFYLFFS